MDPNTNLSDQLQIARDFVAASEAVEPEGCWTFAPDPTQALRLAELVIALDEWITKGGFLPEAWDLKARRRS